jgi:hypothetical protein
LTQLGRGRSVSFMKRVWQQGGKLAGGRVLELLGVGLRLSAQRRPETADRRPETAETRHPPGFVLSPDTPVRTSVPDTADTARRRSVSR